MADYGVRKYDSFTGRFMTADVLFEKYPAWNPYHYSVNNPITFRDGNGYEHYVSTTGEMIDREAKDADDPTVYMVEGGEDKYIGKIGGKINISIIMQNILEKNASKARNMDIIDYYNAVKTGGNWDLKNNQGTIFGLAWSYDEGKLNKTKFNFGTNNGLNAADIGNYHAGYTGRNISSVIGIPPYLLWKGAGFAETTKAFDNNSYFEGIGRGLLLSNPIFLPSGDRMNDFYWNTRGMIDADIDKLNN